MAEMLDKALKHPFPENDPFGLSVEQKPDRGTARAPFPCFFRAPDEPDPGPLNRVELLALLNQLIEGERAGARGVGAMSRQVASAETRAILREIASDEARFCAMLIRHATRLDGAPNTRTGAFYTKLAALERTDERLDLLNRGQGWVVRKLSEALPRIADAALRADLRDMLEAHLHNIERCTELRRSWSERGSEAEIASVFRISSTVMPTGAGPCDRCST